MSRPPPPPGPFRPAERLRRSISFPFSVRWIGRWKRCGRAGGGIFRGPEVVWGRSPKLRRPARASLCHQRPAGLLRGLDRRRRSTHGRERTACCMRRNARLPSGGVAHAEKTDCFKQIKSTPAYGHRHVACRCMQSHWIAARGRARQLGPRAKLRRRSVYPPSAARSISHPPYVPGLRRPGPCVTVFFIYTYFIAQTCEHVWPGLPGPPRG